MSESLRRWRLVLGEPADETGIALEGIDLDRDRALSQLYDSARRGGLGGSSPKVARWLGDIRTYFPSSVVRVMQQDAMERLGLRQLLLEPEMLEKVEPDINLVSTMIGLGRAIPDDSKETARQVVRTVTDQLEARLRARTVDAMRGALNRATRTNRPRHDDIDWHRTILANLKHYQPDYRTIIPERLVGFGRKSHQVQRHVTLCIDQSGSMASSIVYSSVFGAVMASLRAVKTRLVVFDTAIADLTEDMSDPVDVLFGVQLGGGTDIAGALGYCADTIERPSDTIVVLITDLYEGNLTENLIAQARSIRDSGATLIVLLALTDKGAPSYDAENAAALAQLGIPAFACTPDLFPDLMAAAIEKKDIATWAARNDISTASPVVD